MRGRRSRYRASCDRLITGGVRTQNVLCLCEQSCLCAAAESQSQISFFFRCFFLFWWCNDAPQSVRLGPSVQTYPSTSAGGSSSTRWNLAHPSWQAPAGSVLKIVSGCITDRLSPGSDETRKKPLLAVGFCCRLHWLERQKQEVMARTARNALTRWYLVRLINERVRRHFLMGKKMFFAFARVKKKRIPTRCFSQREVNRD